MLKSRVKQTPEVIHTPVRSRFWPVLAIIAATLLIHLFTNGRYGFYRDELQFMSDARHLDWGYVAYPPVAPVLARFSMSLFGISLAGLRLFPLFAQTTALFVTALMTKELGGEGLAPAAAVLAVGFSIYPLYEGRSFVYTSFDYLWWVLAAYFTIRLLKSGNPRWWLAIGAIEGFGLLTKYSMAFLIAGLFCGMIFTGTRRYFRSGWFWCGCAIALMICLPNILWQLRHSFISYDFIQFIHARDIASGATGGFLIGQPILCINPCAAPICLVGLIGYLRSPRYRMLGWMYIVPLTLFFIMGAREYYLAPAYPVLMAMGAVMGERWVGLSSNKSNLTKKARHRVRAVKPENKWVMSGRQWAAAVFFTGVILWGTWSCVIILPLQSKGPLRDFALRRNDHLPEEFGWEELVRTVASIRDSLPPDRRASLGIMVGNYGEEGAIEILGSTYHLPPPISAINSGWLRGYPTPPPTTLIVIGFDRDEALALFSGCNVAGHNGNSEGIANDESTLPDIFLCGPPRQSWPELWKGLPHFL